MSSRPRNLRAATFSPGSSSILTSGATGRWESLFAEPADGRHFGAYGGSFVPETLMHPLEELKSAYAVAKDAPDFQAKYHRLLREFVGRPSPLTYAARLTEHLGGA